MNLVEKAITYATAAHAGVNRKGKDRPYILHPLEAMTIVGSMTDDEDLLAAAVLHDTIEDTDVTREDLEREFGKRVADIVSHESENKRPWLTPEESWQARKMDTVTRMLDASRDEKLVCLGDKLSNLREIARDYNESGELLWQRFSLKDKAGHSWYYHTMYDILAREFGDVPATKEYRALLGQVFGKQ